MINLKPVYSINDLKKDDAIVVINRNHGKALHRIACIDGQHAWIEPLHHNLIHPGMSKYYSSDKPKKINIERSLMKVQILKVYEDGEA